MLEILFLGTSASAPSVRRGLPATVILHGDGRFLVDAGEGTQRQVLRSGIGFKHLDKVLLTHGHLDHILGLGGLVSTYARWEAVPALTVYGGRWAIERVRALMEVVFRGAEVELGIDYVELQPGPVLSTDDLDVVAFPVRHRGSGNFGFVFQERSRRPFLADRAEALGIPEGPERRELVRGCPITLADGRVVQPDEVLGPVVRGTKLVFVGDVSSVEGLDVVCREADCLVCESTYLLADQEAARQFGHLTAYEAALLAQQSGVHGLILTHISRRYAGRDVLNEARAVFPAVWVAEDFDRFVVRRGELRKQEPET